VWYSGIACIKDLNWRSILGLDIKENKVINSILLVVWRNLLWLNRNPWLNCSTEYYRVWRDDLAFVGYLTWYITFHGTYARVCYIRYACVDRTYVHAAYTHASLACTSLYRWICIHVHLDHDSLLDTRFMEVIYNVMSINLSSFIFYFFVFAWPRGTICAILRVCLAITWQWIPLVMIILYCLCIMI